MKWQKDIGRQVHEKFGFWGKSNLMESHQRSDKVIQFLLICLLSGTWGREIRPMKQSVFVIKCPISIPLNFDKEIMRCGMTVGINLIIDPKWMRAEISMACHQNSGFLHRVEEPQRFTFRWLGFILLAKINEHSCHLCLGHPVALSFGKYQTRDSSLPQLISRAYPYDIQDLKLGFPAGRFVHLWFRSVAGKSSQSELPR